MSSARTIKNPVNRTAKDQAWPVRYIADSHSGRPYEAPMAPKWQTASAEELKFTDS